jgi:uncharacterized protein (DUF885 family)
MLLVVTDTGRPTAIFELADHVVELSAADDPTLATLLGVVGYDARLSDYSPEAAEGRAEHVRGWLARLEALPESCDEDRLAAAVMRERLGARLSQHDAGEHLRDCNDVFSPVQATRDAFTMMETGTEADWEIVAQRLEAVPDSLTSTRAAYAAGVSAGLTPARRQVLSAARSAAIVAGTEAEGDGAPEDWFASYVGAYPGADESLRRRLLTASRIASSAYDEQATWMRDSFAPQATEVDGVGADRYQRLARFYCGTELDLADTYQWGWQELAQITARMNRCAAGLYGGVTPAEAKERLDADPEYSIEGAEAARDWLQRLTDDTVTSFDGTYFDIPEVMRRCETRLAAAGAAPAPYYTPPSEDFVRPGRTWLPTGGETTFGLWSLRSTWFHEAVPGHHLQVAFAMFQRERLSRFQRVEFVSGHAEGWALYAERLMDELGYFDDPAYELGYLGSQALRAARIVVDIGLHLELAIPTDLDPALLEGLPGDPRGEVWSPDLARIFLSARSGLSQAFADREVDRYLGCPGQAIAYKVGERVWLAAREDARSGQSDFDLKSWHMNALALGSVGLDVLRAELARTP